MQPLTSREAEVLELLVTDGGTNRDMAEAMGVSIETVRKHLYNILNKTGYGSRLELAVRTLQKRYGVEPTS